MFQSFRKRFSGCKSDIPFVKIVWSAKKIWIWNFILTTKNEVYYNHENLERNQKSATHPRYDFVKGPSNRGRFLPKQSWTNFERDASVLLDFDQFGTLESCTFSLWTQLTQVRISNWWSLLTVVTHIHYFRKMTKEFWISESDCR